jgi:hypothetical protein
VKERTHCNTLLRRTDPSKPSFKILICGHLCVICLPREAGCESVVKNITTDYHRLLKSQILTEKMQIRLLIIIANKIIQGEGWLINAISGKGRNQLWRKGSKFRLIGEK